MTGNPKASETDGFLPILLVVAAPLLTLLAIGLAAPPALELIVGVLLIVAVFIITVLLFKLTRKFVRENCGPGGLLETWRPRWAFGLWTVINVLLRWLPFGALAVIVFCVNGLLVDVIAQELQSAIESIKSSVKTLSELDKFLNSITFGYAGYTEGTLSDFDKVLVNLLQSLQIAVKVEHWLSWLFLMWLTVRSVLYFFARLILAEAQKRTVPDSVTSEVRFDMELMR